MEVTICIGDEKYRVSTPSYGLTYFPDNLPAGPLLASIPSLCKSVQVDCVGCALRPASS